MELTVLGKPSSPGGPLKVSEVTDTKCKLGWKKPADDGGSPIKEYEIEKMDLATGKWVRVGRVPASDKDEPTFEVTGLNPGSEYKFRVTACNNEGDSEPLVTEQGTVAKNPFGILIIIIQCYRKLLKKIYRRTRQTWYTRNYGL